MMQAIVRKNVGSLGDNCDCRILAFDQNSGRNVDCILKDCMTMCLSIEGLLCFLKHFFHSGERQKHCLIDESSLRALCG